MDDIPSRHTLRRDVAVSRPTWATARRHITLLLAMAGLATVLLAPSDAEAMVLGCPDEASLPVAEADATVPANLQKLHWRYADWRHVDAPTLRSEDVLLERTDGEQRESLAVEVTPGPEETGGWLITPEVPLPPNTSWRLRTPDTCLSQVPGSTEADRDVHFSATDAAPQPTELGELVVHPPQRELMTMPVRDCIGVSVFAKAIKVEVELDDSAAPWADILEFETRVNGGDWTLHYPMGTKARTGHGRIGHDGRDWLFVPCRYFGPREPRGLEPGEHTVYMRARLPGGEWLHTQTQTVYISCNPVPEPQPSRLMPPWTTYHRPPTSLLLALPAILLPFLFLVPFVRTRLKRRRSK